MSSSVFARLIGSMTVWSVCVMPKYFHISISMVASFPSGQASLYQWESTEAFEAYRHSLVLGIMNRRTHSMAGDSTVILPAAP
jgi:hypothetical protein